MSAKILLVEDTQLDQKIVVAALSKKHSVTIASTLAEATKAISRETFDLVLLDVELPDGNGFRFFSSLQADEQTKDLPVIFLTSKSEAPDEVMGFSLGAEDYIAKPADPIKLWARIEAKLRKLSSRKVDASQLRNPGLKVDFNLQRAFLLKGGEEKQLDLTPLELKVLAYFMRHEDHVFSRGQIIDHAWGSGTHVIDRTVDMHVSNLRKKIEGSGYTIKSLRGVGYRFLKEAKSSKALKK